MLDRMVLLGATGDLAGRYLYPGLVSLHAQGELPTSFELIGGGRQEWSDETFRDRVQELLEAHAADLPQGSRAFLLEALRYRRVDVEDQEELAAVVDTEKAQAIYLALPPAVFPAAVEGIAAARPAAGSRVVFEKPFGENLEDARSLNRLIRTRFGEGDRGLGIYRVDHVLGMPTVENLQALRFANQLIASLWSREHIERIEIRWEETIALEGRAGFYDEAGALEDVMQNHMLQLLALVAMEPSGALDEIRDLKLEALRKTSLAEGWGPSCRRGRYTHGSLRDGSGREVPDYVEEDGVDPARMTETFAEVVLEVDTPRWEKVPFILRAGKALDRDRKEIRIHFRSPSPQGAGEELRIGIDGPTGIRLCLEGTTDLEAPRLISLPLQGELPPVALTPYGHVLRDILSGGLRRCVHEEEAEEAWRILEPVMEAWEEDRVVLEDYEAGSAGPAPLGPAAAREETMDAEPEGASP